MLVLSRRVDETIVFPNLGVTIRLLRIKGQAAQIGIDAPPHLAVLRGELAPNRPVAPERGLSHDLANRLNRVTLHLHVLRRQQERARVLALGVDDHGVDPRDDVLRPPLYARAGAIVPPFVPPEAWNQLSSPHRRLLSSAWTLSRRKPVKATSLRSASWSPSVSLR